MSSTTTIIKTKEGDEIDIMKRDPKIFLDRSILIFGGSEQGKSTLIKDLIYLVLPYIPGVLISTPVSNFDDYNKIVDTKFMTETLTTTLIDKIWNRQEGTQVCKNLSEKIDVLKSLYNKCNDTNKNHEIIRIEQTANVLTNDIRNSSISENEKLAQITKIDNLKHEKIKEIYKSVIMSNGDKLKKFNLSDDEKLAIKFMGMNNRFLFVIDDKTEALKQLETKNKKAEHEEQVNKLATMFYKCRHNSLTMILGIHADKSISTEIRGSCHIIIFCSKEALLGFLGKKSNSISKEESDLLLKFAEVIFDNPTDVVKHHRKLIYNRISKPKYSYFIARLHENEDNSIKCKPLAELLKHLPSEEEKKIKNNTYLKKFINIKEEKKIPRFVF